MRTVTKPEEVVTAFKTRLGGRSEFSKTTSKSKCELAAYRQLVSPVGFHVCKACGMPFQANAGDFNCERELVCDSCVEAREQSEEQYFDLETLNPIEK